jgi:endoglucanase
VKPARTERLRRSGAAALTAALVWAALAAVVGLAGCVSVSTVPPPADTPPPAAAPQLHVFGNKLIKTNDTRVVLRGVDRSGTEFECVQGHGIFDGPSDQASIIAMRTWHINAVRIPLNEACWDGESYVDPAYAGPTYQHAIETYVKLLNSNGMVAILDLHWTDGLYTGRASQCSSARAVCQKPMPDMSAIRFWTSVAGAFKGNDAVIFDLFNEPYPEIADHGNETEGWQCWLHGGNCAGISYRVAGMQSLVNAVRSTGANNVIMLSGLDWANDLTQWLSYLPSDPDHNLVASWHSYNHNVCNTMSCWTSQIAPVIARVPVIAGEIGERGCGDTYVRQVTAWLDSQSTSYLAWAWDVAHGPCVGGSGLISNYNGTPTSRGAYYKVLLQSLSGGSLNDSAVGRG